MSGKPNTTSPTPTVEAGYKVRYAYTTINGTPLVEYIGKASPGILTSAGGWQITKFTYDGGGNVIAQDWAGGSDDFKNTQTWDNRTDYPYS